MGQKEKRLSLGIFPDVSFRTRHFAWLGSRPIAPWGQGFPEPRFEGQFRIEDRRVVGGKHARLVLAPRDGRATVAAIAFGAAGRLRDCGVRSARLVIVDAAATMTPLCQQH